MDRTVQSKGLRSFPSNNSFVNKTPSKRLDSFSAASTDDQKENTQNQIISLPSVTSMSSFFSQSSDDSNSTSHTPIIEETSTPVIEKKHFSQLTRRKEVGLFCESMRGSIDEAFLATRDSLDDESTHYNRPSISETAYLMKSFSTDEMNAVRPISQTYNHPSLTTSTMMGAKKLSLINPSAMKAGCGAARVPWQLSSPTDSNLVSPGKALKRKYKSRSHEEVVYEDV